MLRPIGFSAVLVSARSVHARNVAQAGGAELGAGQGLFALRPLLGRRELEIGEDDMVLNRGIAEQDVEKLRRIVRRSR